MKKLTLAKSNLAVAYFGSPDFAAYFLEKLLTDTTINQLIEVKLIVTQKDKLVGRKQILTPTPVKIIANKYKITNNVSFPPPIGVEGRLRRESMFLDPLLRGDDKKKSLNLEFDVFKNIDLALVYAYGDLIPKEFLNLPKYGFWNIHPSLLPKYRGPSPIAAPIINGDKTTGVTIIKMDEEIDHGPIIAQESLTIEKDDKRPDLEKKLTDLGFEMFKKIIKDEGEKFFRFCLSCDKNCDPESLLTSQDHKQATYTKKLSKHDGFIEFENLKNALVPSPQSLTVYDLFRGLTPWPGIWTLLPNGKRLKITNMSLTTSHQSLITKVQLEGKNEVDFETFNEAYKIL